MPKSDGVVEHAPGERNPAARRDEPPRGEADDLAALVVGALQREPGAVGGQLRRVAVQRVQEAGGNRAAQLLAAGGLQAPSAPATTVQRDRFGKGDGRAEDYPDDPHLAAWFDAYHFLRERAAAHPDGAAAESSRGDSPGETTGQDQSSQTEGEWHNDADAPNFWYTVDGRWAFDDLTQTYYRATAEGSWEVDESDPEPTFEAAAVTVPQQADASVEPGDVTQVGDPGAVVEAADGGAGPSSVSDGSGARPSRVSGSSRAGPSSASGSSHPRSVAALRQQLEAASGFAPGVHLTDPRPPRGRPSVKGKEPALDPAAAQPPGAAREAGRGVPTASGTGTNLQNAVVAAAAALEGDLPGLDPTLVERASVLVGKLLADHELLATHPPGAGDQILILNLLAAVQAADNRALGGALRSVGLAEDADGGTDGEADGEEAGPQGSYLAHQRRKLAALQQEMADELNALGPQQLVAKAARTVKKDKAVALGKTAVKTGVGIALGHSGVPGLSQAYNFALAVNQVRSTLRHLTNLSAIRAEMIASGLQEQDQLVRDLDYLRSKKKQRAIRSGVGGVPGVGTAKTVVLKGKGLLKIVTKTRGVHRKEAAERLRYAARSGNAHAQLIILEIVGKAQYKQALTATNGADLIIAKMSST